ncbi:thiolase family protein [Patescibacteria group bacterium]|nr:thiolase family protein [Patescibacteria group bacterium]
MKKVVIVSGCRTAIGRAKKGFFKNVRPDDLAVHVINGLIDKTGLDVDPIVIDEVRMGCSFPEGEQGMQPARIAVLASNLAMSTPGITINRFCSSGLQAIVDEMMYIAMGFKNVVIAGGLESMSMIPMGGVRIAPNPSLIDDRPKSYLSMGLTAELLAEQDNNTREEQDEFSLSSHQKAIRALDQDLFTDEILPYLSTETNIINDQKVVQEIKAMVDECPRRETSLEALAKLKPVFKTNGTVTAGNSSQMSDGAAAVMIMNTKEADYAQLEPLAHLVSYEVVGVPPEIMGMAPVEAIPKALASAELTMNDIDLIELNEAFASQTISVIKRLKIEKGIEMPLEKLNVNGGAIALGHPMGCTGAYLTIKAINEGRRRKSQYVMVSMCIGGGMGAAAIFKLLY